MIRLKYDKPVMINVSKICMDPFFSFCATQVITSVTSIRIKLKYVSEEKQTGMILLFESDRIVLNFHRGVISFYISDAVAKLCLRSVSPL